jgi:hypothetical protein
MKFVVLVVAFVAFIFLMTWTEDPARGWSQPAWWYATVGVGGVLLIAWVKRIARCGNQPRQVSRAP